LAKTIVKRAIESFEARRDVPVFIPNYEVDAEIGFSVEYATSRFGSMDVIAKALQEGKIRGVVNLVAATIRELCMKKQ